MSLTGEYEETNIFAKILRGEAPAVSVFADDVAFAFLDIFPQSEGHTLVIPKTAGVRNLLEMPTAAIGPYMERVQRVAKGVVEALRPDGLVVTQFNGAPAGQTVFHLHFHLIPRFESQPLKGHGQAAKADDAMLAATAAKIRAAITSQN